MLVTLEEAKEYLKFVEGIMEQVTLKIKYGDFKQITRSISLNNPISSHEDIRINIYNLFKNIDHNHKEIRLIGVTLSNLIDEDEGTNITFFEYIDNKFNNND